MQSAQTSAYRNLLLLSFGLNSLDPHVLPFGLTKIYRNAVDKFPVLKPTGGSQGLQDLRMGNQTHSLLGLLEILK